MTRKFGNDTTIMCLGVYKKHVKVVKVYEEKTGGDSNTKPTDVSIVCSSQIFTGSLLLVALFVLLL